MSHEKNIVQKGKWEQLSLKTTGLYVKHDAGDHFSRWYTSRSSVLVKTWTPQSVQITLPVSGWVWTYLSFTGMLWLPPLELYTTYLTPSDTQTFRLWPLWLFHLTKALQTLHWALSTRLIHQGQKLICWHCWCTQCFHFFWIPELFWL